MIERLGHVTLVECRLETGRTHQIRVHMKHIGHILFNDERYGGNVILRGTNTGNTKQFVKNCFDICPRQVLHARTLGFVHPRTGEFMSFESGCLPIWRSLLTNGEPTLLVVILRKNRSSDKRKIKENKEKQSIQNDTQN